PFGLDLVTTLELHRFAEHTVAARRSGGSREIARLEQAQHARGAQLLVARGVRLDQAAHIGLAVERLEHLDEALDLEPLRADPARARGPQPEAAVLGDPGLDVLLGERHGTGAEDLERVE